MTTRKAAGAALTAACVDLKTARGAHYLASMTKASAGEREDKREAIEHAEARVVEAAMLYTGVTP